MKIRNTLALAIALLGLAIGARAVPINGNLFFTSSTNATLNGTGPLDATQVTSWGTVSFSSGSGTYAPIPGGTTVTMGGAPWTFGSIGTTGANVVSNLWSISYSGVTYSFDLATLTTNGSVGSVRILEGLGTAKVTGYDNTTGFFSLSTSGTGTSISFSAFANVPPVPDHGSTLVLLGIALVGFAAVGRRLGRNRR